MQLNNISVEKRLDIYLYSCVCAHVDFKNKTRD